MQHSKLWRFYFNFCRNLLRLFLKQEYGSSLILHKIVFILGNLGAVALAVYKCHTMGLLPNHESDWLDFMSEPERLQLSLSFDIV